MLAYPITAPGRGKHSGRAGARGPVPYVVVHSPKAMATKDGEKVLIRFGGLTVEGLPSLPLEYLGAEVLEGTTRLAGARVGIAPRLLLQGLSRIYGHRTGARRVSKGIMVAGSETLNLGRRAGRVPVHSLPKTSRSGRRRHVRGVVVRVLQHEPRLDVAFSIYDDQASASRGFSPGCSRSATVPGA